MCLSLANKLHITFMPLQTPWCTFSTLDYYPSFTFLFSYSHYTNLHVHVQCCTFRFHSLRSIFPLWTVNKRGREWSGCSRYSVSVHVLQDRERERERASISAVMASSIIRLGVEHLSFWRIAPLSGVILFNQQY